MVEAVMFFEGLKPRPAFYGQSSITEEIPTRECLLAVDSGLRTGLALYDRRGRLLWWRSKHFGDRNSLKRAIRRLLAGHPGLSWVIVEGGGDLGDLWIREASRFAIPAIVISAEDWRETLLYQRERRRGVEAKRHALSLARRVISWSRLPLPAALREDAAEAVLAGLWGLCRVGWIPGVPPEIRRNP